MAKKPSTMLLRFFPSIAWKNGILLPRSCCSCSSSSSAFSLSSSVASCPWIQGPMGRTCGKTGQATQDRTVELFVGSSPSFVFVSAVLMASSWLQPAFAFVAHALLRGQWNHHHHHLIHPDHPRLHHQTKACGQHLACHLFSFSSVVAFVSSPQTSPNHELVVAIDEV